ncbi:hypothetical protein V8C44DRAFT_323302 [Trichoderma aethiopicum]
MTGASTLFPSVFTPFTAQTDSCHLRPWHSVLRLIPLPLPPLAPWIPSVTPDMAPVCSPAHVHLLCCDHGHSRLNASSKPAINGALYAKSLMVTDGSPSWLLSALLVSSSTSAGVTVVSVLLVDHPARGPKAILLVPRSFFFSTYAPPWQCRRRS